MWPGLLKDSLDSEMSSTVFWSDSMCVLKSMHNVKKRFTVFWKHRMETIRKNSELSQWRYVPTQLNVADLCTKGLMPDQLDKAKVFYAGPDFLKESEECWPVKIPAKSNDNVYSWESDVYLADQSLTFATDVKVPESIKRLILLWSDVFKLRKVFAWIWRFYGNLKLSKEDRIILPYLSVTELQDADLKIVQFVQMEVFADLICYMENYDDMNVAQSQNFVPASAASGMLKLRPILYKGILRVGGRLSHTELEFSEKYPVILPADHHYTKILIEHFHKTAGHRGPHTVLSNLRQGGYWVLNGITAVKKVIGGLFNQLKKK